MMKYLPWPLRFRRTHSASIPQVPQALLRSWEENGFVILPNFYNSTEIDAVELDLRNTWAGGTPRVVVDDLVTGQRLHLSDVDARRSHRFKVNDLYLKQQATRYLGLNTRIVPILTALLGRTRALCNSLNFAQGSAQADHVNALLMTPRTAHHLVAVWVALEDCHAEAGPSRYYPGSHKIPQFVFSNDTNHFAIDEMHLWNDYMQLQVKERGLEPQCATRLHSWVVENGPYLPLHNHKSFPIRGVSLRVWSGVIRQAANFYRGRLLSSSRLLKKFSLEVVYRDSLR